MYYVGRRVFRFKYVAPEGPFDAGFNAKALRTQPPISLNLDLRFTNVRSRCEVVRGGLVLLGKKRAAQDARRSLVVLLCFGILLLRLNNGGRRTFSR